MAVNNCLGTFKNCFRTMYSLAYCIILMAVREIISLCFSLALFQKSLDTYCNGIIRRILWISRHYNRQLLLCSGCSTRNAGIRKKP